MKVLFFANTDWYLFNFRLGLAAYLREQGIEVVMVSPPGPHVKKIIAAGFRHVPLPMDRRSLNPLREVAVILRLARIYKREQPNLLHHFTIKSVVHGSIAARVAGIDSVVNAIAGLGYVFSSNTLLARIIRPLVAFSIKKALGGRQTRVIFQNEADRHLLCSGHLVDKEHTRLIAGSGVDTERFRPPPRRDFSRIKVLLASRLLWDKGIGEYVEAARRMAPICPELEFLLAGDVDAGNPSSISRPQLDQWRREGAVRVLGQVADMALLLKQVHVVVLPTAYGEGVPRILLEAAACGVPIIATDAPGCTEVVVHGVNGLLVPPKDVDALVRALTELLDADKRLGMGVAGRAKVLEKFDEQIVFTQTFAVYRELSQV
jgi:glycosyltransferase involved in cell wall biosynthesis